MRRTPPTRALDHEFQEPARVTGGARIEASQAAAPFAELIFDREVARLSFRYPGRPSSCGAHRSGS